MSRCIGIISVTVLLQVPLAPGLAMGQGSGDRPASTVIELAQAGGYDNVQLEPSDPEAEGPLGLTGSELSDRRAEVGEAVGAETSAPRALGAETSARTNAHGGTTRPRSPSERSRRAEADALSRHALVLARTGVRLEALAVPGLLMIAAGLLLWLIRVGCGRSSSRG